LEEAGINQSDIDHLELHDCFSIAALISLEDMGFANPGEGISLYEKKGKIDLSATMEELEIDDVSMLTPDEREATVRDLLKARSGIYHAAAYETRSMKARRPKRGSHPHGTFWYYNNWDFNALGGVFQQQTGLNVFEAFKRDIADPIGMNDFSERYTRFVYEKQSSRFPAYTFRMSTRDRARFGLLCLRNGEWSGEQLIPSKWFRESTLAYSKSGSGVGYGYLWWVSVDGWHLGNKFKGRPYSARGNHGQKIVVIPEMQLVVVQSVDKSAGDEIAKGKSFNTLLKLILAARKK
jgi:CubicO group peptidase (beta-lactamase class C family)